MNDDLTNFFATLFLMNQIQGQGNKMRITLIVKPDLYQLIAKSASFHGKSIDDFVVGQIQSVCEVEQRAIKELDDFLEPTIIALDNGEISDKTFDEIVNEALEEIARERLN